MPPKKPKPATCDLCCKQIQEGKEEALHCEGGCGLWFHRYCAGVSVSLFKELAGSPEPFLCYICYQRSQLAVTKELRNEVAYLKSEITKLSEQLAMAKLSSAGSAKDLTTVSQSSNNTIKSTSTNSYVPTYATSLKQANNPATTSANPNQGPASNKNSTDKKFNVVMYGLSECFKGSPRHERISCDTNLACNIIKSICPDIGDYAICDCSRIGPYSESRTRPLIVKFARSYDVATVLSNRFRISKSEHPNVYIKPFMSAAERKTESTLLKERRALIDSGVERRLIKIRGNSIYINRAKVGSANEDTFIRHSQHSIHGLPRDCTPTSNDSSNTMLISTSSNSNGTSNATSNNAISSNDTNTNNAMFTITSDPNNTTLTSNTANAMSTGDTSSTRAAGSTPTSALPPNQD